MCQRVIQKEQKLETEILKDYEVVDDIIADEPYSNDENDKNFFGFINMQGAIDHKASEDSPLFRMKYPKGCTPNTKIWMCTKCEDFFRMMLDLFKNQLLWCSWR